MPAWESYGHYDSGFEDLADEREKTAWNSNATFSERAFAEATNMGCLDFMAGGSAGCGGRRRKKLSKQQLRDIDTFKCIPMRPPLNPVPALDDPEIGAIFNPRYDDPRYLRPDIPIPDDYAPDPNGFPCDGDNPCQLGDIRPGYKQQDPLPNPDRRPKLHTPRTPQAVYAAGATPAVSGSVCDVKNLKLQYVFNCTMSTLGDVVSDFQHWSDVPGDSVGHKLGYVFGSDDRPFYLGLFLVLVILAALVVKLLWSLAQGKKQPAVRGRYLVL